MKKFLLSLFLITLASPAIANENSAFDRIMAKKELRCGYVNYPPLLSKDPNTDEFSGIGVDIVKRVAEILDVKITWAEEVTWATYIEGLRTNRYDMLCTLDFFLPAYAGKLEMTSPVFYTGIGVYKRPDDARFPEGFRDFNKKDISISAIDGSLSMLIKNSDYPDATLVSMPNTTDYSFILSNIVSKKADVTFVERSVGNDFLKKNPGALVNIAETKPLRIYPYFIPVDLGEAKLKSTLEGIISLMLNNGEIDKILDKYEQGTPSFYRVVKGYQQ